jgi:adenine phosphoribosyltransferase
MADIELIKSHLTEHPDFPKKVRIEYHSACTQFSGRLATQGIVFLDIFPLLRNPTTFETLITHIVHHITSSTLSKSPSRKIDVIVGLDARGFLLGPSIALRLGAAFVPVRKQGKLPGKCVTVTYEKEYGYVSSRCHLI